MTKFLCSIFALAALPAFVFAQSATLSNRRVALTVAPNISYTVNRSSYGEQFARTGFHTRIDGEFRLHNRLWLRIGTGWSRLRFKSDLGSTLQWPSQNNGNGQYDPTLQGEESIVVLESQDMLNLPCALRYYFGKKQQLYADLETGISMLLGGAGQDVLRPNLGFAAGWQANVAPQSWIFVQPAVRFVFDTRGSAILKYNRQHRYSLGLELGVRQGLK